MRHRRSQRKVLTPRSAARVRRRGPVAPVRKQWAFFFYLCGDNHLAGDIESDCEEICRVGSSSNVHIVVQQDRPDGARRYLLPEGRGRRPEPTLHLGRINTGEPKEAVDFLLWGIEQAPADHIAVVLGSPGINPFYLVENLPRRGRNREESDLAGWVERHLFSICHDKTSNDALQAWELRTILDEVVASLNRPIDLVGLDMGGSALVEIAFQMEGLARVLVASQRFVSDDGWPYEEILTQWQKRLARTPGTAHDLAQLIIERVSGRYAGACPEGDVRVAAIDLMALAEFARAFDTLTMALLQSLGDWHVLDACRRAALPLEWIHAVMPRETMRGAWTLPDRLPAVDVLEFLENLWRELRTKLTEAPRDYGQRDRVGQLTALVEKSLNMFMRGTPTNRSVLIAAWPWSDRGLSIVFPPLRTPEQVEAETGPRFHLARSNYLNLNFSRQVHWAAFIGAFQLIQEKPHVLWRLISSMLADATGPAREAVMQRLLSPDSVLQGLKRQFQSLGPHRALTLSVDPQMSEAETDRGMFRLRLESTVAGAVVAEHESRIYQPALDATLGALEQLLATAGENPNVLEDLESLGRTLGEDILQDLADRLEAERKEAMKGEEPPHLRLQIPRELMRYPWELMSDGRGLVCERYAVGRQVFMAAARTRRIMHRRPGPIEVLIIGNPPLAPEFQTRWKQKFGRVPPSLPGAEHEAHLVAEAFERLNDELAGLPPVRVTRVIGQRLTGNDFRRLLRQGRYDIVHYAGHARFDSKDPEASAWLLSDGLLRAREIRNTLAWTASPPWLVFANACEAAQEGGQITGRYQGDVFGLATAFINQGVAAYIAPLWKVDDEVATHLAIDFYRGLIGDRLSLGEALRRARVQAKLRWASPPRAVASWASLVLYGDPTPRLLESLWTPHAEGEKEATAEQKNRPPSSLRSHAAGRHPRTTVGQIVELATGPVMELLPSMPTRGERHLSSDQIELRLMEQNGIRYWVKADRRGKILPLSPLSATMQSDRVRNLLAGERGFWDYPRVVARWIVGKISGEEKQGLLLQLVEQYDRDVVPAERLVMINPDGRLEALDRPALRMRLPAPATSEDRLLLLIHGTFSRTESPVRALGEDFFRWAYTTHRAVIGFEHWTLSKTPEENAQMLWELLDPRWRTGGRLDIIAHSRGGLVARAFIELLGHGEALGRVVFVGTPNAGTNLANPACWGRAADWLVNFIFADRTGLYGRLSGFLARLCVSAALGEIPGLQAQNPTAAGKQAFLARLQEGQPIPPHLTYAAVAANYEPDADEINLKTISSIALDGALDQFYGGPNDLVVDTASVWAIDASKKEDASGPSLPAERLLVFNPDPNLLPVARAFRPALFLQTRKSALPPTGAQIEPQTGVHHTNLLEQEATRRFLQKNLSR